MTPLLSRAAQAQSDQLTVSVGSTPGTCSSPTFHLSATGITRAGNRGTACLSRHDLALVPPDDSVDGGKVRGEDAVACDEAGVGVAAIQERDAVDGDPGIACNALVDNAVQPHATAQAFHASFDVCILIERDRVGEFD